MKEIKINNKLIAIIAAAITILTAIFIVAGYAKYEPEIKYGEFPISITYELDGETVTLEDTITCEFMYGGSYLFDQYRRWDFKLGQTDYSNYVLYREDGEYLFLETGLTAHYLMDDPLFADTVKENEAQNDGSKLLEPYGVYGNSAEYHETKDPTVLAEKGFKIVSYEYPEPIENKYRFVGIDFNNGTAISLTLISAIVMLAFMFIIRKDKDYKYSQIDHVSFALNILTAALLLPPMIWLALLWGIDGTTDSLFYKITVFGSPILTVLGIGLSVLLRRRRFKLPGLLVQFVGPLMFCVLFVCDLFVNMF